MKGYFLSNRKINVLMPVYNTQEAYLREAIESILNQTYSDFDLIIVNDGSTNNAQEVILSYKDDRIKYFINEKNLGLPKTRNKLLELAKAELIAFMDSDDVANSDRFEKQVDFFDKNPEVGVLGSWFQIFPDRGVVDYPSDDSAIKKQLLFECSAIGNSTAMIRYALIEKSNLKYDESYNSAEDYAFWLSLVDKTSFANIPEVLVDYRWHTGNISKTDGKMVSINAQKAMIEAQSNFFNIEDKDVIAMIEKIKNNQKITSKELLGLIEFAAKVKENIKTSKFLNCEYQFNHDFYKLALKKCKKDFLYFKILFTKGSI